MSDDVAAKALAWAISKLGEGEVSGRNDGPWVERILGEDKRLNWCAAFVLRAFQQGGAPLPGNFYKNRAVKELEARLREAGAEIPLSELAPGDIVTFAREGGGHVGIAEELIRSGGDVIGFKSIEGNVGNAVRRVLHQLHERDIRAAFRWPAVQRGDSTRTLDG